jgi:hypothetical protein
MVTIITMKPRKAAALQIEKEQRKCAERVRRLEAQFAEMKKFLTAVTGGRLAVRNLLGLANHIAEERHIKVDRVARRLKDALICWFCENVSVSAVLEKNAEWETKPFGEPLEPDFFPPENDDSSWNFDFEGNT